MARYALHSRAYVTSIDDGLFFLMFNTNLVLFLTCTVVWQHIWSSWTWDKLPSNYVAHFQHLENRAGNEVTCEVQRTRMSRGTISLRLMTALTNKLLAVMILSDVRGDMAAMAKQWGPTIRWAAAPLTPFHPRRLFSPSLPAPLPCTNGQKKTQTITNK